MYPKKIIVDKERVDGTSIYSTKKIKIDVALPDDMKLDRLTHETAHMAMIENGMHSLFDYETGEAICELCASVFRIMKKNGF